MKETPANREVRLCFSDQLVAGGYLLCVCLGGRLCVGVVRWGVIHECDVQSAKCRYPLQGACVARNRLLHLCLPRERMVSYRNVKFGRVFVSIAWGEVCGLLSWPVRMSRKTCFHEWPPRVQQSNEIGRRMPMSTVSKRQRRGTVRRSLTIQ